MSSAPSNPNAMDEAMEGHAETLLSGNPGFWLGPQLVGAFVDALLCGIMIMQFVQWVSFSQADRLYTKVAVYGSFTAGIAGTIYSMWCAIHVYVYGFGVGVNFLSSSYISNLLIPDSITALLVQTFFAERAYRLIGNSKVFLGIAGALILFSFGSSIALLVEMKLLTSITQMPSLRTVGYTWVSAQLAADLAMTGTIMISLETQLPPTILAFGLMITHVLYSSSTLSTGFIMVISKAYICGLLGALLSRYHLRRDGYSNGSKNTFKGARSGGPTQDTIHVATETYVSTGRPVRPVTTNRASSYGDNQQQHTEGHGKNAYERSEMKRSSAAKSDYGDYESTKVLTA
ncbi:hypothetical protein EHS25_009172 [Saitozyma podzolica]|uniref:Uncharacterized protein n=1 Tax=Saitozyma podzolica TaxID=1890683 RepID=A0A427YL15_9TREE|nr:hypothetical protein EHS25_009172 [Saitozyma podzolica]